MMNFKWPWTKDKCDFCERERPHKEISVVLKRTNTRFYENVIEDMKNCDNVECKRAAIYAGASKEPIPRGSTSAYVEWQCRALKKQR